MSPKNIVLIAAAALVVAMAVYLFVQVRATPAQAGSARSSDPAAAAPPSLPPPSSPTTSTSARPIGAGDPGTRQPAHFGYDVAEPRPPTIGDDAQRANSGPEFLMEAANKAYDRQEFEDAIAIAGKVLSKDPTNVRMLRIMVSANCIQGDGTIGQSYYEKLPKLDRDQMKARCDRYGVTFKEPPQ